MKNPLHLPLDSQNILITFYLEDDIKKMLYYDTFENYSKSFENPKTYMKRIVVDRMEVMYYSQEENEEC